MSKLRYSALLVFCLNLALTGCSKKDNVKPDETNQKPDTSVILNDNGDSLTEEQNAYIEEHSIPVPSINEFIDDEGKPLFPNKTKSSTAKTSVTGQAGAATSETSKKKLLISAMINNGIELCNQKNSILHKSEGVNKPEHWGLVYSYGQRNLNERLNPPAGNDTHRKYAVYGTDCSGLIIALLKNQDVNISTNTAVATFEENLSKQVKAQYPNMTLANYGSISIDKVKNGDFILWKSGKNNHMGMVAVTQSKKVLIQSNGTGSPNNDQDQAKNFDKNKRGVHMMELNTSINGNGYWGKNYQVLRFLEVGEKMEGGLLIALNSNLRKGMVCAEMDQSTGIQWDPTSGWSGNNIIGTYVAGTSSELFTGASNTKKIVSVLGSGNNAASLCDKLVLNGYDDWALPSQKECDNLRVLYAQNIGNFANDIYWTSTDSNDSLYGLGAKSLHFGQKKLIDDTKYSSRRVRAVREFTY